LRELRSSASLRTGFLARETFEIVEVDVGTGANISGRDADWRTIFEDGLTGANIGEREFVPARDRLKNSWRRRIVATWPTT
jgi:hypothetical protein